MSFKLAFTALILGSLAFILGCVALAGGLTGGGGSVVGGLLGIALGAAVMAVTSRTVWPNRDDPDQSRAR